MIRITTRRVLDELDRRNIRYEVITEAPHVLIRYWHQGAWRLLHSTMPEFTAGSGKVICDQKYVSMKLAQLHDIPVPETISFSSLEEAQSFVERLKSVVIKPADGAHGNGITVGVAPDKLEQAIRQAEQFAGEGGVLLQQRVAGSDLRLLVIGGKFVAAARRVPAGVFGDGGKTLRQLIDTENTDNPERGEDDEKRFSKINLAAAERYLGEQLDTEVPAAGERVQVVGTANIGAGGHAVDYTDNVSAEIIADAEKFAKLARVAACGVDFIWDEAAGRHYFIEGNACPGFNLHIEPSEGTGRPVAQYFVDFLLSPTASSWESSNTDKDA